MKAALIAGVVLIVVGLAALITGGITYTHEKKDVDMGPLQIEHKQTSTIPISPIVGGIALIAGIALAATGTKKS
jgi:hypothetical protein